jgi:hypothetical protein
MWQNGNAFTFGDGEAPLKTDNATPTEGLSEEPVLDDPISFTTKLRHTPVFGKARYKPLDAEASLEYDFYAAHAVYP